MQRHIPSPFHSALLCAACLSMAGCGNKGELYLKDDPNIAGSDGSVEALIDAASGDAPRSEGDNTASPDGAPGNESVEPTLDSPGADKPGQSGVPGKTRKKSR